MGLEQWFYPLLAIFIVVMIGYSIWDIQQATKKSLERSRKKHAPDPLEVMPVPVFRDIEEVAKSTPEYKEAKKKQDAKHRAAVMERNKWGMDFTDLKKELKRKHCKHVYNHGSDWQWYVCTECGYEDTPYYTFECDCEWHEDTSYYHRKQILTRRNPLCRVHGRDIQKYQNQRYEAHVQELFAKGGIIKKEY